MDTMENSDSQVRPNSSCANSFILSCNPPPFYGTESLDHFQMAFMNTTTTAAFFSRHRNLSGPCSTGGARPSVLDNRSLVTPPPGVPGTRIIERDSPATKEGSVAGRQGSSSSSSHRKLDRSLSDSEDRLNGNGGRGSGGVNSSRYKTELCRPYEENGHCKYGDKCQFAHGAQELRSLTRHPKYKTERCKTFHTIGFCPYGPRCHFIHNVEEHCAAMQRKNANIRSSSQKPSQFSPQSQRPTNLCALNSLGSSFESVSSSSSPGNMSPSHFEDSFPVIGTFSPSAVADSTTPISSRREANSRSPPNIFTFPASETTSGSMMTPLDNHMQQFNMQTRRLTSILDVTAHLNALNISQYQNQLKDQDSYSFSSTKADTNLNMCQSRQQREELMESFHRKTAQIPKNVEDFVTWRGTVFPPPSNSPFSDDSMGSNGSPEPSVPCNSSEDSALHLVNSPLDVGRSMRLPIFNQLSTESQSS